MARKRKNHGYTGSKKGRQKSVQCHKCNRMVPRGKAKRVTKHVSVVDRQLGQELRKQGTIMPHRTVRQWFCISCAIHTHKVNIRSKESRR